MDCHNCEHLRYDGCHYGRCVHRNHRNVSFSREKSKALAKNGFRVYNRETCPDFILKKRCANCKYWKRGRYFADGKTPAEKGRCSLRVIERGKDCPLWTKGSTTTKKVNRTKKEKKDK